MDERRFYFGADANGGRQGGGGLEMGKGEQDVGNNMHNVQSGMRNVSMTWGLLRLVAVVLVFGGTPVAGGEFPVFTDVTRETGIDFHHRFGDDRLSNIVEGTGAGVVLFDFDGDGWLDVYFVCGCWHEEVSDNRGRKYRDKLTNRLYRNLGDGRFEDVTEAAGVGDKGFGTGASAVDYDGDGDVDLYVLNYGKNVLYRNEGNGTFTDVSSESGLDNACWSLSSPWFDYDGDGNLDVYVANYLEYDAGEFQAYYPAKRYPGPLSYSGQPDALYRNNGDGSFTEVTQEAGVLFPDGRAMSATAADLDNDGLLDIYVANDAMENYFFRNLGNGRFENVGLVRGLAFGEGGQGVSSMGPTTGDIDRDGWLDVYIPDMGYGCLLMNRREFFDDRTAQAKLTQICGQYTGWGAALFDADNDGYLDLFIANGNPHWEFPEEDVLVRNDGTGNFIDVTDQAGPYFRDKRVGRGATYGDLDNDGDLDLVVVNLNDHPVILRNDGGNRGNWLKVNAQFPGGESLAIGARVTVKTEELSQMQTVMPMTGYLSQADPRLHFGLNEAETVESIEVRWPNGERTELRDVAANQLVQVTQDAK
ncbi:MAG: CRTAC1 family protein [Planctomycetota bacterium]